MKAKRQRTIIDLSSEQQGLDFEHTDYLAEFTLPDYQRGLLKQRAYALLTDMAIVFGVFLIFVVVTFSEMPNTVRLDREALSVYGVAYLVLLIVYLALSMLSNSQTTGMYVHQLVAVTGRGTRLNPKEALYRSLGYAVSAAPLFLGFLWAFVDPEHLTWTDKVSGTFVKRVS
jgi:uncharacterized RDD family membrane protein YckC